MQKNEAGTLSYVQTQRQNELGLNARTEPGQLPEEIIHNILFETSLGNTFVSTGKSSKAKINGTASKINLKRCMHLCVHCSIIYNSQDMNATSMTSIDKWIKKTWYVCVCV